MIDVSTHTIFTMDDINDGFVMRYGDILEYNGKQYCVEDATLNATIGVPVEMHYTLRELSSFPEIRTNSFGDGINPMLKIVQTNPTRGLIYSDNTVISKPYHGWDAKIDIEPEEDNKEEWAVLLEE